MNLDAKSERIRTEEKIPIKVGRECPVQAAFGGTRGPIKQEIPAQLEMGIEFFTPQRYNI